MAEHHNHLTRDIKPRGECPACDESWAKLDVEPSEDDPRGIIAQAWSTGTAAAGLVQIEGRLYRLTAEYTFGKGMRLAITDCGKQSDPLSD